MVSQPALPGPSLSVIRELTASKKCPCDDTAARHSWWRDKGIGGLRQVPALPDLSYLFTSWSRVLLEKLTGFAASQEIPHIYGTRKFITVLTSVPDDGRLPTETCTSDFYVNIQVFKWCSVIVHSLVIIKDCEGIIYFTL
jgi:hypothetical protein